MIITDNKIVLETLHKILDKECYIAIDQEDIQSLFGESPQLRMIQVAAHSISELIPLVNQDILSIGGLPDKSLAAYVSMDLKMSDLELLADITKSVSNIQYTVIFERNPLGNYLVYYFFN